MQIVEYGRCFLDPNTDWSINYLSEGRAAQTVSYLGPLVQELAFRLAASPIGPRLSTLIGAITSAILCKLWLSTRGTPPVVSAVIAAIFLLEPTFVQSYRGGRVDAWVFVFIFCACFFLARAKSSQSRLQRYALVFLAGLAAAVSVFTWVVAVLCLPLVVIEFMHSIPRRMRWRLFAIFCSGGLVAASLLCIPAYRLLHEAVSVTFNMSYSQVTASTTDSTFRLQLPELWHCIKYSPFIFITAFSFCAMKQAWTVAVGFCLILVFILSTNTYTHRYIYLLPYMTALLSIGIRHIDNLPNGTYLSLCTSGTLALAFLLVWAVGITLIARPFNALTHASTRSPDVLDRLAATHIRHGASVYIQAWEFYYVGRRYDWKMYRPFGNESEALEHIVPQVAYVIIKTENLTDSERYLFAANFVNTTPKAVINKVSTAGFGGSSYGPYSILRRREGTSTSHSR